MSMLRQFEREVSEAQDDLLDDLSEHFWKPWALAHLAFAPWFESATPVLEALSTLRAWLGFVITAWLCWPYLGFGFLQDSLHDLSRTIFIAGIVMVVVLIGGLFLHAGHDRRQYLIGAALPLGRIVLGIGAIELLQFLPEPATSNFLVLLVAFVVLIWLVPFYACAFWHIGKSLFGTADAHPVLGPTTSALTLTVALVYKLGFLNSPVPAGVSLSIDLCGYVSAVGLCAFEIIRIFVIQRSMPHQHVPSSQPAALGVGAEQPDGRVSYISAHGALIAVLPYTCRRGLHPLAAGYTAHVVRPQHARTRVRRAAEVVYLSCAACRAHGHPEHYWVLRTGGQHPARTVFDDHPYARSRARIAARDAHLRAQYEHRLATSATIPRLYPVAHQLPRHRTR